MISPISTSIDDINTAANQFVNPTIFNIVFESFTHNDKFAYVGTKVGEIKVIPLATKKEECLEINDVRSPTAHKQYSQGSHANLFEQVTFHESEVSCLKVSIDNCYLASGSYDRTVKWWSLSLKSLVMSLELQSMASCLDVSNENQYVVAGTFAGSLIMWQLDKNQTFNLEGHSDKIKSVQFTINSNWIVSGSDDASLRLWSVKDKLQVRMIEDVGMIQNFCVAPNGMYAAVVAEHVYMGVWKIEETNMDLREGHTENINCLAISKDSVWIATGSNDTSIRVWSVPDNTVRITLQGHEGEVTCVDLTSDSKYVISSSSDCTVRIWNIKDGVQIYALDGNEAQNRFVRIIANNRFIICGSYDDTIRIWNTEERTKESLLLGHEGEVKHMQISRDGKYIISGGSDNNLIVWNTETSEKEGVLTGHDGEITALALSTDSQYIISAGKDDKVQIWPLDDLKKQVVSRKSNSKIIIIQITLDNLFVVSAAADHSIRIWSVLDPDFEFVLTGHTDSINSLHVTTDSQYIVTASRDNTLRVWSLEGRREIKVLLGHEDHVFCMQLTRDNYFAVSGGDDSLIIIWDIINFQKIATLSGHKNEIKCLQITKDQQYIVSGSNDKTVRIWDFYNKRQVAVLRGHEKRVTCLEITNDNKFVISGSDDAVVRIWSIEERRVERVLKGHEYTIHNIKISSNDLFFASASKDKSVRLWKLDEFIVKPPEDINSSSNKDLKIYGYDSGMLNQVFVKKLVTKEVPDEFMIAAVIAPIKINLLHYYCFFDMVDNLARAMEIGAPIFKDIFGRSPLHYAIERRSRRCLDLILQSIINCNNEIQLEQNMHGLRDDVIKLLESHSDFILPFFESIFRKSEDPDHIFFAATRKPLPMTIFAPTMMPSVEDFVFRKDEITNQPEFLVQIWVSPLSWNFQNGSKESIKFLKAIEGCPAIEIYQTPLIRSLVRLKWKSFQYFTLFWTFWYAMNITFLVWISSVDDPDIGLYITFYIINFMFVIYECFQIYSSGLAYFKSSWNYQDIIRLVLTYTWSILGAAGVHSSELSFFTVISNFLRGLVYFRAFDKTRFYVRLIIRAAYDTVAFLVILLYSTFGFAIMFRSASQSYDLRGAWKASFELDMGGLEPTGYGWIEYSTFTLGSIINVILMLNLLISILGDSFDRFKESQKSLDYKEMLDVIIEFESLMFWARNTGKRTYLQKCDYYKKSEKENNKALEPAQNLQNELESLKRQLSENYKEKSEQIKKEVNERITEKIESLDKKFLAIERQMQNQESRINEKLQQILDALKFPA